MTNLFNETDKMDLTHNFNNLIVQVIAEGLNDDSEYLESDGGKFWLDLGNIDERRINNALNFKMDNSDSKLIDTRYIMERLGE